MSYKVPREFNEEDLDLESELERLHVEDVKAMPIAPSSRLPMPPKQPTRPLYTQEKMKKFANIEKIKFELDVAKAQRKADEETSKRLSALRNATSKRSGGKRKRTRKGRKGKKGRKTRNRNKISTRRSTRR